MSKTLIEWADRTWNPVTGCTPISEGCANCYAARMAKRLAGRYGYPKDEPFLPGWPHPDKYNEPFRWRGQQKVFVCSMGDLFHESVPIKAFADVMDVILNNPQHTFMMLTKRPMNMFLRLGKKALSHQIALNYEYHIPLPNLWLGVTAENQRTADERIPILLQIPAAVRFVSVEPMLAPVDLTHLKTGVPPGEYINSLTGARYWHDYYTHTLPKLDWVICGAETGPRARFMDPTWAWNLRYQCQSAGIPFFFKKWSKATTNVDMPREWPR